MKKAIIILVLVSILVSIAACSSGAGNTATPAANIPQNPSGQAELAAGIDSAPSGRSSPTGTLSPEPADGALFELEMYAGLYGITVEEARRRFAMADSFRWLGTELEYQEAETFAGLWLQHQPDYRIVVCFTRDGERTLRKYVPQESVGIFEVRSAEWTLDQLRITQIELGDLIRSQGINFSSWVDVYTNRVQFQITPGFETLYEKAVQSGKIIFPEYVDVFISNPPASPVPAVRPANPAPPVRAVPPPLSPLPDLNPEESPLLYLLKVVPSAQVGDLRYDDIPAISAYRKLAVPPPDTSAYYRDKWWMALQSETIAKFKSSDYGPLWGLSVTEIEGILLLNGPPTMTVLGGHLNTKPLREKLKAENYTENTFLGYSVFSEPPGSPLLPRMPQLPTAVGIIENVEASGEKVSLIIYAVTDHFHNSPDDMVKAVESALRAYKEKTALGYQSVPITKIAGSLGRQGSIFFSADGGLGGFARRLQETSVENLGALQQAIGPGKLSPYNEFAVAYRGHNYTAKIEFTLAYDDPSTAL